MNGALTPLFWTHVNRYGRFRLDMNSHLHLTVPTRIDRCSRRYLPGPTCGPGQGRDVGRRVPNRKMPSAAVMTNAMISHDVW